MKQSQLNINTTDVTDQKVFWRIFKTLFGDEVQAR